MEITKFLVIMFMRSLERTWRAENAKKDRIFRSGRND